MKLLDVELLTGSQCHIRQHMAECHADSAVQLPLSSALYGQGNSDSHKGVHPFSHFFFFHAKKNKYKTLREKENKAAEEIKAGDGSQSCGQERSS